MAQVNTYLKNFVKCTSAQYENLKSGGQLETNKIYLKTAQSTILDRVYPVGTIYTSLVDVSPASFLGGTWSKITGNMFLRSATSGVVKSINSTGGRDDKVIVAHSHNTRHGHTHYHEFTITGTTNTESNHAHDWLAADTGLGGVANALTKPSGSGNYRFDSGVATTGSAGSHYHTFSFRFETGVAYIGPSDGTDWVGNTDATGTSTAAGYNLPPYKSAYMWIRMA